MTELALSFHLLKDISFGFNPFEADVHNVVIACMMAGQTITEMFHIRPAVCLLREDRRDSIVRWVRR